MRSLLNASDSVPIERSESTWEAGVSEIDHPCGVGLDAWLNLRYRKDGPLVEGNPCESWCDEDCDKEGHVPDHHIRIDLDTTYSYMGPNGEGCGGLHARLIAEFGLWLDEQNISWGWNNEFTGEDWMEDRRYEGLAELAGNSLEAREWFTGKVLPAILAGEVVLHES